MEPMYELAEEPMLQTSKKVFGINYLFPWQRLIVASVLDAFTEKETEPLRRIAVLPTGAGKSLCWMLPAVMIPGITIAVFPLLSLMSDQERRLREAGVKSVSLRGSQKNSERQEIWNRLEAKDTRIVLANPEILQTQSVAKRLKALNPAFLAVDETHTVSQWGETFRPACAGMGRIVQEWQPKAVLALTATAGPLIRKRIQSLLFNDEQADEALANPDRPAIHYGVLPSLSRLHSLEYVIRHEKKPTVVFGRTRSSVEQAARILRFRLQVRNIRFYHAGLLPEEKHRLEDWFLKSEDGVLCATCAYGMGVDKPNVRTVVHLAPPASTESYLQESGRAARDGGIAHAWLIWTPQDILDSANKTGVSEYQIAKQNIMLRYITTTDRCRRAMLLESLDIETEDCSGCDVCSGDVWKVPPEEKSILYFARRNRNGFLMGQMARALIGRRSEEIRRNRLLHSRGFGILGNWELEDAEEAISSLLNIGKLQLCKKGWNRGKIVLSRTQKASFYAKRFGKNGA